MQESESLRKPLCFSALQASLADSFVDLVSQAVIAIADIRCTSNHRNGCDGTGIALMPM